MIIRNPGTKISNIYTSLLVECLNFAWINLFIQRVIVKFIILKVVKNNVVEISIPGSSIIQIADPGWIKRKVFIG
jgi:hypothetical protein